MDDKNPSFYLEGVIRERDNLKDFEGPLSLILMLLSKNKIEIRDIKIAEILDQYTDYLNKMQEMDLDIASEFIRMAAYLLYIKTKMLLTDDSEEISELEALIESLEFLKAKDNLSRVKEVTPVLQDAYKNGALFYSKSPEEPPKIASEYRYSHKPVELLQAISRMFSSPEKIKDTESLDSAIPRRVVYSIRDKSRQILSRLKLRNIELNELYSECRTTSEIVATFMSVLELCSIGSVLLSVSRHGDGYELSFAGGDVDEIIEQLEE